ncbi:hypothetical protein F2Q69_00052526 [Brassica cretica]|uniref:Uncharacterized protein n=1 Tax=Brassica cretica TaxID=69181 RepID=A0A8S9MX39_BRACR|nr:hypothetical protein F2Q69_00052526 [Brassica cretica]
MGRQQDRMSRLQDPYGSSEIFASCCTIFATSATPPRALILAMCSGPLRLMPLIAAHYDLGQQNNKATLLSNNIISMDSLTIMGVAAVGLYRDQS